MTIHLFDKHKLLVEGVEDSRVLPELLDARLTWGNTPEEWIADIQAYEGVDDLLRDGEIETQLKTPRLEALGIVLDANADLDARWQQVRGRCSIVFPDLPETIPKTGLIVTNEQQLRLGVWIMPDNQTSGMLETFLSHLLPDPEDTIWKFACEMVQQAIAEGAPVKPVHIDKARIHTWLALQDPPGQRLEIAVKQRLLDPQSDRAQPFIDWFVKLYDVADRRRPPH